MWWVASGLFVLLRTVPAMADERLIVLQKYEELLSGYDPATGDRVGPAIRIFAVPHEMAATADGRELFITNYGVKTFRDEGEGANTVTVVNMARLEHAGIVDLGAYRRPHGIARGRSGRFYVTTDAPPALLVIDPVSRAVIRRIPLDQKLPHMVVVTPNEKRAVVANSGSGTVTFLSLAAGSDAPKVRHLTIGGTPMGLLLSADGRWLYATNRDGNQVALIDMRVERITRQIPVLGEPTRLAFGPGGRLLIISALAAGAIVAVDTKTFKEVARISVGRRPEGLLVDADGGRGFVSVQDDNKVVEFSLSDWKVLREIKTGEHPDALWLDRLGPTRAANDNETIDGNAAHLLTSDRLAELPFKERDLWTRYLETSARLGASDRDSIAAELRTTGRQRMTPAPYRKLFGFEALPSPEWFRSEEGRRIVGNVLSFQTPSGGWSKHVDVMLRPRNPGESYYSENEGWSYIATFDNDSTTDELRFLLASLLAVSDAPTLAAYLKGISYLLSAQFPNGCWPQVYPLKGGYHDAVTFNDNVIVNIMRLMENVANGHFAFVPEETRLRTEVAVERGLGCIVATQIVEHGVRTIWAQQHDPLTLVPVAARAYELAGLSGRESAAVTAYLMSCKAPSPSVVEAVHAAATWFRHNEIRGYDYDVKGGLREVTGGGPIWARIYEPRTGKPIFSNRDGIKRYDWRELSDRRFGYTWYTKDPAAVLSEYEGWFARHSGAYPQAAPRR
jgi:PelA/Pel-15E family pectate lyase